ncbi:MAG: sulfotransferase domain-containing protein [Acidimicrobiales bacterium]
MGSTSSSDEPSRFLLTFPKCGSQWVRDVLTHSDVLSDSGLAAGESGVDLLVNRWPSSSPGLIHGPLYFASLSSWEAARQPGERAVVVLRDPRDIVVSWVYSIEYSHQATGRIGALRSLIRELDLPGKLLLSMAELAGSSYHPMKSWRDRISSTSDCLVIRYESLAQSETDSFQDVFEFLQLDVSQETMSEAIAANSFEMRSGRTRGDEDVTSHFRSASPGDWMSHFDEYTSLAFEALFPGLLVELGYESTSSWSGDVELDIASYNEVTNLDDAVTLATTITRLTEANLMLTNVCQQRLELIEELSRTIHQ